MCLIPSYTPSTTCFTNSEESANHDLPGLNRLFGATSAPSLGRFSGGSGAEGLMALLGCSCLGRKNRSPGGDWVWLGRWFLKSKKLSLLERASTADSTSLENQCSLRTWSYSFHGQLRGIPTSSHIPWLSFRTTGVQRVRTRKSHMDGEKMRKWTNLIKGIPKICLLDSRISSTPTNQN